jgi:hypothetical protein
VETALTKGKGLIAVAFGDAQSVVASTRSNPDGKPEWEVALEESKKIEKKILRPASLGDTRDKPEGAQNHGNNTTTIKTADPWKR